jgi:IS30 family transposase
LTRKRFTKLLAQGQPLAAAAREVGAMRTTAYIWRDGTAVRRKDSAVKVVPQPWPLSLRPISSRFLFEEERILIADLASRGARPTEIAALHDRSPSTISRELRRNVHGRTRGA